MEHGAYCSLLRAPRSRLMSEFQINAGEMRTRVAWQLQELGKASPMGSVPSRWNPARPSKTVKLVWLSGDKLWQALSGPPRGDGRDHHAERLPRARDGRAVRR